MSKTSLQIAKLADRHIDFVLKRRWLVIILSLLFTVVAATGLPNLTNTTSYRVLFGEDNPELLAYDQLQDTYSASRSALIAVAPKDGSVFTGETLAIIESLTESAWQTPYSVRVNSLTNYFYSEVLEDDLAIAPLVEDALSFDDEDLQRVREIALNSPELAGLLVSEDGHVAALAINFVLPEPEEHAWAEITGFLRNMLDEARNTYPEVEYYLTGDVIMNQTFTDAAQDDASKIPIAFIIILAVTALILRSLVATFAISVLLIFSVVTTMGISGWLNVVLTPISAGAPIIIVTIGVAHAIHIILSALANMRDGEDRDQAIRNSLRHNLHPVFLTSATTLIGFLSMNTSSSQPFHVLGNVVALGVVFAFIFSITTLPSLLSLLPLRATTKRRTTFQLIERVTNLIIKRSSIFMTVGISVVVVLAVGMLRNDLSDNWIQHFDESYQFRSDSDFVAENLTGLYRLDYSLESGRDGGVSDPEYLRKVDAFVEWYKTQPLVHKVQAFTDVMKRVNQNMHGDEPEYYRIPDNPELAAQFLLLYELSLPFGADLNDRINIAKSALRMSVILNDSTTTDHLNTDARAQDWLQENTPEFTGAASGFSMIAAHMSNDNIRNTLLGTVVAGFSIWLILLLVFRNLRIGLLCVVPNFFPVIMSFGLWGYLYGKIGIGGSVVAAIALGIIVDDTIHFVANYVRSRRLGQSSSDAVRSTIRHVGPALCATTAILSVGFLVFATSGYEPGVILGLMVTLTLVFALVADLLILPPLLMAIDREKTLTANRDVGSTA